MHEIILFSQLLLLLVFAYMANNCISRYLLILELKKFFTLALG